ncbi:rho guanine nucleotide exchange factor 37 isoform X2 [Channa argus]|uniref:rho guanine nucleotide exchange factor 37 isoform X2 n=1 Tax=Channa argus TaxID=215402 RepID=UPI003522EF56
MMEVPRRPQPASFTLPLPKPGSSALSPLGAVQTVSKKDPMKDKLQEKEDGDTLTDHFGEDMFSTETEPNVSVDSKLCSQDSFLEDSSILEERSAQEAEEARKKSEEEQAAAKERAAERQALAIEELVLSERNYLRLLQVSTVTIRSSLQKLQPPPPNLDSMFLYIEDVIDVSSRFLSLLDQKQMQPGDPVFLTTLSDKYKKTETLTIKDKINRLNTHSIAKKTARLSQQIKHETGMASKLVDEEFDALEDFFNVLEHGILDLLENVETYLHHLQGFLQCKTEEFDLDMDGEKAPICYKEITTALRQWILPTLEKRMRTLIHKPLCALHDLLVGPRNLIKKRLDKLLDYEMIEAKSNLSYDEQAVANTYRTINTLLLNELPQFNGLALQMIWSMLGTFSCLHKDLASDMEQLFQSFAQQLPHSSLDSGAFWKWAESAALEGARRLETLCRSVQDTLNAPFVQPLSPSSQRRLKQLTDKHGFEKIYQVIGAVVGSRDLDLNLAKGELVAIISEADSRGDKRRWLVDAGGRRGYVPSSKLIRYHQPTENPPPSPHPVQPEGGNGVRRHSYTPESRPLAVASQSFFQMLAAYDFTARGSHEVSVRAGEPVHLLERHDKRGNPEWSLVQVRGGQKGYVPSNYLAVMPMRREPPGSYQPHY